MAAPSTMVPITTAMNQGVVSRVMKPCDSRVVSMTRLLFRSTAGTDAELHRRSEHALAAVHVVDLLGGRLPAERGVAARIAAEAPQHLDMGEFVVERLLLAERREQPHRLLMDEQRFRMHVGHVDEGPAVG